MMDVFVSEGNGPSSSSSKGFARSLSERGVIPSSVFCECAEKSCCCIDPFSISLTVNRNVGCSALTGCAGLLATGAPSFANSDKSCCFSSGAAIVEGAKVDSGCKDHDWRRRQTMQAIRRDSEVEDGRKEEAELRNRYKANEILPILVPLP